MWVRRTTANSRRVACWTNTPTHATFPSWKNQAIEHVCISDTPLFISFAAPAIDNLSIENVRMYVFAIFPHTVLTSITLHSHMRACSPMAADYKNLADCAVMNSTQIELHQFVHTLMNRAMATRTSKSTWCCACLRPHWITKRTHPQHYTDMSIHTDYYSSASRLRL